MVTSEIVKQMKSEGFTSFTMQHHTDLWKQLDAKAKGKTFGTQVAKTWYWYDDWVDKVRAHCRAQVHSAR